jgi:Tol biopolymer transport system component
MKWTLFVSAGRVPAAHGHARAKYLDRSEARARGRFATLAGLRRPLQVGLAVIALALGLPAESQAQTSGKIVFARATTFQDGTPRSSYLLRENADGSRLHVLTPNVPGTWDASPTWSPKGGLIAYTRHDAALDKRDIRVMTSGGGQDRQITSAPYDSHTPAWGPDGQIAFIYDSPDEDYGEPQSCVGIINPDGSAQQTNLFCPDRLQSDPPRVYRLDWSANGDFLYLSSQFHDQDAADYSVVYRVNARTGAAVELALETFEPLRDVPSFAPDGSAAVYCGNRDSSGLIKFDFNTGEETPLVDDGDALYCYAPLYSKDGSKVAFTRAMDSGGIQTYEVFVVDADGCNLRQLTTGHIDDLEYTAVEWSDDGKRLLLNRSFYTGYPDQQRSRRSLRMVDVHTRAMRALPAGYAYPGAWFEAPSAP